MDYIRNLSKISAEWTAVFLLGLFLVPNELWGAFASQFSLGLGEQYSDNIFFQKNKEHDFITTVDPTLSFFYAPLGETSPTGSLTITPSGQIYARHSEFNNFGDNISANAAYAYRYSPRLNFNFSDSLQRQGPTRTGGLGEPIQLQTGPTTSVPGSGAAQNLRELISSGDLISNSIALQGSFLYQPDISFSGHYSNSIVNFIRDGGSDVFHTIGGRGVYNWRQDHNLHAGYSISISNSRNGNDAVIHNFDIGDDYFSNYTLQLTPTLSVTASSGLSLNVGNSGPRVANNTNLTITKLWETAVLNAGLRKGLTPSFGISGISDTTSIFGIFNLRFTERLSTQANADWSFFDTKDVNFKTFRVGIGLQYLLTNWLSAALNYRFNQRISGSGSSSTDLLERGTVSSNAVSMVFTTHFDIWPNVGLARGLSSTSLTPVLKTPIPVPSPVPTKSP